MKKIFGILIIAMLVIFMLACGEESSIKENKEDTVSTTEVLFMVNSKLYYGTDETGPMGSASSVEGEIVSSVEENEIPSQNAESNFGCIGNPYTYAFDSNMIMILMDDEEYHIFYEKEIDE